MLACTRRAAGVSSLSGFEGSGEGSEGTSMLPVVEELFQKPLLPIISELFVPLVMPVDREKASADRRGTNSSPLVGATASCRAGRSGCSRIRRKPDRDRPAGSGEGSSAGRGHARSGRLHSEIDPVHRITTGDRLEVGQRRADGQREVLSAARRDAHVLSQDWCPLLRRHCHEVNGPSTSVADDGVAMRCLDVLHPIRPRAEHRYEVTFALHGGDHDGVRASAAGLRPRTSRTAWVPAAARDRTTSPKPG